MKVNLINNQNHARNGYVNVDPRKGNLDGVVEGGEADEVVALGVLDYFNPKDQKKLLGHWASRLRRGGVITVSCTDLFEVSRALVGGHLDERRAVEFLYGAIGEDRKASLHSELTLKNELQGLGLEVVSRRTDGVECVVTAKRIK